MKNFSIQSFTLMMMMMTVSSAAVQNDTAFLMHRIHHEANLMTNMSSELKNIIVTFPGGDSTTCWTEFFCLVEKSLNSTSLENTWKNVVEKLTILVEQYNKVKIVNCTGVDTNPTPLSDLVEKIKLCSVMKRSEDKKH